mgnify:CR=1 FL=1
MHLNLRDGGGPDIATATIPAGMALVPFAALFVADHGLGRDAILAGGKRAAILLGEQHDADAHQQLQRAVVLDALRGFPAVKLVVGGTKHDATADNSHPAQPSDLACDQVNCAATTLDIGRQLRTVLPERGHGAVQADCEDDRATASSATAPFHSTVHWLQWLRIMKGLSVPHPFTPGGPLAQANVASRGPAT